MFQHYQGLGHVAIHTKDMDGSIAFYEKIGGALRQRMSIPTPEGAKLLALVSFGGTTLELIQSPTEAPMTEGCIPHIALYVDDLDRGGGDQGRRGGHFHDPGEEGPAESLRRPGELVLHRPLRGADRAAAHAVI